MSLSASQLITQIYIGYYHRAPDADGLNYWVGRYKSATDPMTLAQIAQSFSVQVESLDNYPFLKNPNIASPSTFITQVYANLFNRAPDSEGLAYWTNQISTGKSTIGEAIMDIISGARDTDTTKDLSTLENKMTVALNWTDLLANTPGASFDAATAAEAREIIVGVTDDDATVVDANNQTDDYFGGGGSIPGETITLTTGSDEVTITTDNTLDTVKGYIDYDGTDDNSTLTTMDTIDGNGNTVLKVSVVDVDNSTYEFPYIEASGVNELWIVDAVGSGTLTVDASVLGSDLSTITFSGKGGLDLSVTGVDVTGDLTVSVNATGEIDVSGEVDGVNLSYSVDSGTAQAEIGLSTVSISAGEDARASLDFSQTSSTTSSDATVGDLVIGSVTLSAASSGAEVYIDLGNSADANVSGDASVGDFIVGDVNIDAATSATVSGALYNYANAASGDATAGDVTLGDITLSVADSAYITLYVSNTAGVSTGDATVGDVNVGNIALTLGNSGYNWFEVYQTADANSGDATAGNQTVGDITVVGGDNATASFSFDNLASASVTGNATVGDMNVGDVSMVMGTDAYVYVSAQLTAYANSSDASVGEFAVGDISIVADADAEIYLTFSASVSADDVATIGSMSVGNIDVEMGLSSTLDIEIYHYAWGSSTEMGTLTVGDINVVGEADVSIDITISQEASGAAGDMVLGDISVDIGGDGGGNASVTVYMYHTGESIGDTAIGNIDLSVGEDGYIYVYGSFSASDGDMGDVTFGDVNFTVGDNATATAYWSITAYDGDIGNFTIGDISVALADSASMSYLEWYVSATDGDIASITVGNISLDLGESASFSYFSLEFDANTVGDVTIGDISINAGTNASIESFTIDISASDEIGNITIGDISLIAASSADIDDFTISVSAVDQIGDIVVGDITLIAGTSGSISADMYFYNSDDIGNVTFGDISISAIGTGASASLTVTLENDNAHDIGDIVVGDIYLQASGSSATASLSFSVSSAADVGSLTIGDITIDVTNTASATVDANAQVNITLDAAGDVVVGDITISAASITDEYVDSADVAVSVTLNASSGDLTIGDITVVGGYSNSNSEVLDNFATLTAWLDASASGTVTVGNVDYSDYVSTADIDVSGYDGAAIIYAAQGDTTITLNDGKNTVYLGDGADVVTVSENASSPLSLSGIDLVYNFEQGTDVIDAGLSGSDFSWGGTKSTFELFVTAAGNADYDAYAAKVGSNTFVAFDADGDDTVDFIVELVGSTATLVASDLSL